MTCAPLPIYTYWVGPQPPWIGLCIETLRRHNPAIQVLDDAVWDRYDGPIPRDTIRRQAPNVQSDYLRAWLLATQGGIWVDADCICFRSLQPLTQLLADADLLVYRKRRIMSALLANRQDSAIARVAYDEMTARLASGARLPPLALGPNVWRAAIRSTGEPRTSARGVRHIPTALVHPLQDWRFGPCATLWQSAGTWSPHSEAYTCMLTHRALGPLRSLDQASLIASPTVIGDLFRRALARVIHAAETAPRHAEDHAR